MWGLTGVMDPRLVSDGKLSDVIFDSVASDSSKATADRVAEVTVHGTINGKPFQVQRKRSSKKGELRFYVDGLELTQQSVKDTQDIIDSLLGVGDGMLHRCVFFGQHSHALNVPLKRLGIPCR